MPKIKAYTKEFKENIIHEHLKENISIKELSNKYNIKVSNLYQWKYKYLESHLEIGLTKQINKKYSLKFKLNVVQYYLDTRDTYINIAEKFGITNPTQVYDWIDKALNKSIFELVPKKKGRKKVKTSKKSKNKTTEEELKKLKRENELLQIENEFLKKKRNLLKLKALEKK